MNLLFWLLCVICFSGCQEVKNNIIMTPKYLTKSDITLDTGEIVVKTNKKELITSEIVRMIGMSPFKFLEEWMDSKIKPIGTIGEAIIEFPLFEIIETKQTQYDSSIKMLITFKNPNNAKKQLTILANVSKGFDKNINYLARQKVLYALIQDLIASLHDTLLVELKKSNA